MAETNFQKLNIELRSVKREVKHIRLLLAGLISSNHDSEGEYQPAFVRHILSRTRKFKPIRKFKDSDSFLKEVEKL